MTPWLHVLGLGEDGPAGLSETARAILATAEILVGGDRHLDKIPSSKAERLTWEGGFPAVIETIKGHRGRRVVVLASGDPMWYGVGTLLARHFDAREMHVQPVAGAFSLACARLGWSLADVTTLTIHGRPLESVLCRLAPGERLLILSADGGSPSALAKRLSGIGWGESEMIVLEHMGGPAEKRLEGQAKDWPEPACADLNVIALTCRASPDARVLSRLPGLPDEVFEHDGQLTKREVRAVTVCALAPLPGRLLWDLGAGAGSIGIEWLRAEPRAKALAVESNPQRVARIARNAANLGVPSLRIEQGDIGRVMADLTETPNAVFLGGSVPTPGLLEDCRERLAVGGRLVANGVTVEAETALAKFQNRYGGRLVRLSVAHAEPIKERLGFKPLRPVTQYVGHKS